MSTLTLNVLFGTNYLMMNVNARPESHALVMDVNTRFLALNVMFP
jgi:hypothetical protein